MLTTTDKLKLYTKNYLIDNPKANVLIVHGLGEHCERYAHVASALNGIGASVYTFDLRGHGRSEGEAVFIKSIDQYRQDTETVADTIPKNLPFILIGHSMGGLISLHYLLAKKRTDVTAVVLSGAAIAVGDDVTAFTIGVISFIARFFPKLKTVKLDPKSIARDTDTVEKYTNDPLVYHGGTKAGLAVALLRGINEVKTKFGSFDYPVLIMHGGDDKITNIEGSKQLYTQSQSPDKTLKIWDGAYHEIFNETNRQEVIKTMTNWIEARLKS
jgi:acylglycerol lipase